MKPASLTPLSANVDASGPGRTERTRALEESDGARGRAKSPRTEEPGLDQAHEQMRAIVASCADLKPLMNAPEGTESSTGSAESWTLVRVDQATPEGSRAERKLVMQVDLSTQQWYGDDERDGEPMDMPERKCGKCQSQPARVEYVVIEISKTAAFRPRLHYGFCPFCYADALELVQKSQDDSSGLSRVYFKVHHDFTGVRKYDPDEMDYELRRAKPWRDLAREADGVLPLDELLIFFPILLPLHEPFLKRCRPGVTRSVRQRRRLPKSRTTSLPQYDKLSPTPKG